MPSFISLLRPMIGLLLGAFITKTHSFSYQKQNIYHRHITTTTTTLSQQLRQQQKAPILHNHHQRRSITPSSSTTTTTLHQSSPTTTTSTIQILMSDTGGGHRASANALRDAFDELHPGRISVDIVDIYTDYGPFWPFNAYVPIYKIMAEYSFLWKWFYEFGATPLGLWLNEVILEVFCFEPFKECMSRPIGTTNKRADMVVSVHPLCQDIPLKILASLDTNGASRDVKKRKTPFVTVVTDLGGAHPTWFNSGVDKCFVPSDVLYQAALDRNVQPSQLVEYGLPIRKGFWGGSSSNQQTTATSTSTKNWFDFNNLFKNKNANSNTPPSSSITTTNAQKTKLRTQLNLSPTSPTVLIVGGGDGMGGITAQAKAIGRQLSSDATSRSETYQMVVVCGKNEQAQQALENTSWGDGLDVIVNGFVYNMEDWMRASDVMVTKAGPGTIAEASICGLPCVLSSFLPGQEEGNVPFVQNAGFGTYSGDPKTIASTVSSWLSSPEKLSEMRMKALEASRPSATLDIARDLADMVFEVTNKNK